MATTVHPPHDRELALRSHIRGLLHDYVLTHLTTDYIAFTEDASAEVVSLFF